MNGIPYTYVKNIQGDIIKILDNTGAAVVSYTYDPWGVPTATGNTTIAEINPCTYRGYDYDEDTGYFYLQSRYYSPSSGRFLNMDDTSFIGLNDTVVSYNLITYCGNSPVASSDPTGYFYISLSSMKKILAVIGLHPVAAVLVAIGLSKFKALLVSKWAVLLAKLGSFWGPVVQAAFTVVGTIVCFPTLRGLASAIWDCIFKGKQGIYFGIKYSKNGIPYGFTVYAC